MGNELGSKALERIEDKRLLGSHLAKVRERLAKEDLSALELKDRKAELMRKSMDGSLSNNARELAAAEAGLVESMVQEVSGPAPTFDDLLAAEREKGNYIGAENLERTRLILDREEAIAERQGRIAALQDPDYAKTLRDEGLSPALVDARLKRREKDQETLQGELDGLRDDLRGLESSHPLYERKNQSEALRVEARELEREEMRLSTIGDRDAALKARGEVDAKRAEASTLVSEAGARAAFEAQQ